MIERYLELLGKIHDGNFMEEAVPEFLDYIEEICERRTWLLGDSLTMADFWIATLYTELLVK